MTDSEKDQARRELAHALDALGDGAGKEVWGPGVVGHKLLQRDARASLAFDLASATVWRAMRHFAQIYAELSKEEQPKFIANMRKLAPVVLELLLDE